MSRLGYHGYETINREFYRIKLQEKARIPFIRKMSPSGAPNMLFIPLKSELYFEFEELVNREAGNV